VVKRVQKAVGVECAANSFEVVARKWFETWRTGKSENTYRFETARRVKENIAQVMRYAIATGRAEHDPCPELRGNFP
jgi:hypothetical protein